MEEFDGQLDYITRHYRVCDTRAVLAAARGEGPLPPNACLLTFDDGLLDHFTTVFPRLVERGLPGSFYVPVAAVESRRGPPPTRPGSPAASWTCSRTTAASGRCPPPTPSSGSTRRRGASTARR